MSNPVIECFGSTQWIFQETPRVLFHEGPVSCSKTLVLVCVKFVCPRVLTRSWRNRLALHAAASVGLRTLLGSKTRCACITSCAYSMHHAHAPPHAHGACTMRMHHLSQRRACRDSIRIAGAGRLREAVDLRFSFAARHPNEYGPQAEGAGPSEKKGTPLR